jgi:hydroxymethylbilane synthase
LKLRIGTRGSRLARWQADWVADRLRTYHPGLEVELVAIKTHGDHDRKLPLSALGGSGLFTKEIQQALVSGCIDLAVHSLKDLPTQCPAQLTLAAIPQREDVADALVTRCAESLKTLPMGARVGTGSLRRRAQLLRLRPDLAVMTVRGNVETRLKRALDGTFDAVVLAWAGLHRLGLTAHVTQRLVAPEFLPAVGQGALGIECRGDDVSTRRFLLPLDDPPTRGAVLAERATLAELGGGCMVPIAAWARDLRDEQSSSNLLVLDAAVFDSDGRDEIRISVTGPRQDPDQLGRRAARALRDQGADALLQCTRVPHP